MISTSFSTFQVITFFAERVEKLEHRSTEYVKETLELGAKQFPLHRLKVIFEIDFYFSLSKIDELFSRLQKFPDLKFKYVEEEEPEEFFVPYIWTLGSMKDVKSIFS